MNSGSCNLGCFQDSCTNQRGTKASATFWHMGSQVWISSNLGLEQSGKSTPSFRCRKGKLSCLDACLSIKKTFWLSRQNGTIWFLVSKIEVAKMGIAKWSRWDGTNPFIHITGDQRLVRIAPPSLPPHHMVLCPDPTQLTCGEGVWCHKSKSLS